MSFSRLSSSSGIIRNSSRAITASINDTESATPSPWERRSLHLLLILLHFAKALSKSFSTQTYTGLMIYASTTPIRMGESIPKSHPTADFIASMRESRIIAVIHRAKIKTVLRIAAPDVFSSENRFSSSRFFIFLPPSPGHDAILPHRTGFVNSKKAAGCKHSVTARANLSIY